MDTTTNDIAHGPVHIDADHLDGLCSAIATIAVLGPDDVLVVRFAEHLTSERANEIAATIRDTTGFGRLILLDARSTLAIARRTPHRPHPPTTPLRRTTR